MWQITMRDLAPAFIANCHDLRSTLGGDTSAASITVLRDIPDIAVQEKERSKSRLCVRLSGVAMKAALTDRLGSWRVYAQSFVRRLVDPSGGH
jgi:hypothetical protein